MSALVDAFIGRARVVLTALVMLVIGGAYAYQQISKESEPEVSVGIVYVHMGLAGVSPEDAERLLVRPMEEELRSLEGVREMTATAYEGGANVLVEFFAGYDIDTGLQDVRLAVDRVKPSLPAAADEPSVQEIDTTLFPVLTVVLSGDVPQRTLIRLARDARQILRGLPQVLGVDIAGDRDERVELVIDPLTVEAYGLRAEQIIQLVARSNQLVTAGSLARDDGAFSIKVPALYETLDDILNTPIKADDDAVVRFRDVAEIRRTFDEPTALARLNGTSAVTLEVRKRAGENIIETIAAVRYVMEMARDLWPEEVQISYTQDRSNEIMELLQDLQNQIIAAILLVMIVLIGAMGWRPALMVGVAIPGSLLSAILLLYLGGYTMNIVVLFSLILSVGLLIDGAIVVTEYADRKMQEGMHRKQAYALAARRMFAPITVATTTTLAAFSPLLFWPGLVGEFMKYLPITLLMTLTASLLMALVFIPTLGAHFGRALYGGSDKMRTLARDGEGDLEDITGYTGFYIRILKRILRFPGLVLALSGVLMVVVWWWYASLNRPVEFFPTVEPEQALVLVHARGNLSIYERDALMAEVEEQVLQMRDEFVSVYTRTGQAGMNFGDVSEDVIGQITVEFVSWNQRRQAEEIFAEIRERTEQLAGIFIEIRQPDVGPPVGKPINIQLSSRNPELLPGAVAQIRAHMEGMEGLVDIEDSRPLPGIDWQIEVDRERAALFGLDVAAVGDALRLVTGGLHVATYRPADADDEVDIVIRYPAEYRNFDMLDAVRIETDAGSVPISNFVTRSAVPQTGTLSRVNGERVMNVLADVAPGFAASQKVEELRAYVESAGLDPAIEVAFRGEDEEQQAAGEFLGGAFIAALCLMALIMLLQFNSFYSVLLILSAVTLSTVGVFLALIITGRSFGIIMTGVGIIALAAIIVNNNIVLIDTYDRLKLTASSALEAILRTCAQRLRPVMLTTVTTVLGLMPMALQVNVNFLGRNVTIGSPATQWWVDIAIAIVFGLSFASLLTLVVTPCALMVRANVADRWHRRRVHREAAKQWPDTSEWSQ